MILISVYNVKCLRDIYNFSTYSPSQLKSMILISVYNAKFPRDIYNFSTFRPSHLKYPEGTSGQGDMDSTYRHPLPYRENEIVRIKNP